MAPIKLEEHIREQLQEREIKTSNNSWEKLQQQIKNTPKKKNNRGWYYLAASIISVVIISSLMLSEKQVITESSNKIVEVSESLNENESNSNTIVSAEETTSQKEVIESSTKEITAKKNQINKTQKEPIADLNIIKPDSSIIIPIESTLITTNNDPETKDVNEEEVFINSKVEEVVAQIKNASNAITDEEINSLLVKAQQEIHSKKLLYKNKVDATELLSIVEDELEENFRDRVFEALGDGYKKVRTAVVNREY